MRKFIICAELTLEITQLALDLNIPEIITGIPGRYREVVIKDQLPAILVESATYPDTILFNQSIKSMAGKYNILSQLIDLDPPTIILKPQEKIQLLEDTITTILSRLQSLENKP